MKKLMLILLICLTHLGADECFRMNGNTFCNNDVLQIDQTGQTILLKVFDIGGGRVSYDIFAFSFNPTSEQGLLGEAYSGAVPHYVTDQFKLGRVTKLYSNTPNMRKLLLNNLQYKEDAKIKSVKAEAAKCKKGAEINSKNNAFVKQQLEALCAFVLEEQFQIEFMGKTIDISPSPWHNPSALDTYINIKQNN